MAKDEVLRIRIDSKDFNDLKDVAEKDGVSASEFARTAIKNRVKRLKKGKENGS